MNHVIHLFHVKGYLRDDIDFLYCLPKTVPENTLLISFDLVKLYSNIPHELGQELMSIWLDTHLELIPARFPKVFILKGIKLI